MVFDERSLLTAGRLIQRLLVLKTRNFEIDLNSSTYK